MNFVISQMYILWMHICRPLNHRQSDFQNDYGIAIPWIVLFLVVDRLIFFEREFILFLTVSDPGILGGKFSVQHVGIELRESH